MGWGGGGGGVGGGGGGQCSSQRSAMKSPVLCRNPEDDRQTIDTYIPVVHALFFFH